MYKVLVPFTDRAGGERAIRRLLEEEEREGGLEVELLAIAEAPELRTSRRYISLASAECSARAVASCWIAELAPLLKAAHVPYQAHIVVGRPTVELDVALHRTDVDRVVLPATVPHWPSASPPLTVVP
jgi:hypothetical protein